MNRKDRRTTWRDICS